MTDTHHASRITHHGNVPGHIAFICDGNRRWAKSRGLSPLAGHRAGVGNFTGLIDFFIGRGVGTLTFYIFSTENWDRSKTEIDFLMKLFIQVFDENRNHAAEKNLKFRVIGRRDRIPAELAKRAAELESETENNTGGTVVFALDYGGHDEILRAVNKAIDSNIQSPISNNEFETFMDTGDLPPVDFMVRAGGEHRISNYLLWKIAYAELFFPPEFWPDFVNSRESWENTLAEFARRNRTFGGGAEADYAGTDAENKPV
ncbi:MAG: di-trans,poly-cis-decaprenylcistransferase [Rickettsiales bacterium]|jgi:undecaprenyl diphosphate synthase|nr:di-trans,poly-cis-decaprenylcistransferase [Rickettsiales bacterium]